MKRIIITGASGLVATELILTLLKKTDAQLFLISTHTEKLKNRYNQHSKRVSCFTLTLFSEFIKEGNNIHTFDVCIHTAFSRSCDGRLIAQSLNYQQDLISILKSINLKSFINISSQSIYGKLEKPLWTETTPVDPDYLYAMGKYTSEIITKLMFESTNTKWTNLRLCSICENARFIRIFVQNAIEGKPIHLTAPDQHCSFIDIRDVAEGLLHLINLVDQTNLEPVYNFGANLINSIKDIAFIVKEIGEKQYNIPTITITWSDSDNHTNIGMNANLFMQTFGWSPRYGISDMVTSMYNMLREREREREFPKSFLIVYNL